MIVDIINKKRLGKILSKKELEYIFNGYIKGIVKDYQMSALLMAICIKGMTDKEIFDFPGKAGDFISCPFAVGIAEAVSQKDYAFFGIFLMQHPGHREAPYAGIHNTNRSVVHYSLSPLERSMRAVSFSFGSRTIRPVCMSV